MSVIKGLEWTFDTAVAAYDKFRPGYAPELYEKLFHYIPIGPESQVLEIGIGAGQATLPVLQTGCQLTAVEYGARFSELCREKFKEFPKFSVITGKFEETPLEKDTYDLAFSATAFHWVPEEIGYPKVYDILKSGGVFARFANHPFRDKGNPSLSQEIDRIYGEYYYPFHNRKQETPREFTEEDAKKLADLAEKYGFTDIQYAVFHRVRTFTAKEYVALLGTYSDHIAIDEPIRSAFFAKIEEAIERHGGAMNIYDTIDLQLARKL